MLFSGIVNSLFVTSEAGGPMMSKDSVQAVANKGLDGDRYFFNKGFWQTIEKARRTVRDVSFIRLCDISKTNFLKSETRRNIVIDTNDNLLSLIDLKFQIGVVDFLGIEDCAPCNRPSEISGKNKFSESFRNTGGLRARVLTTGLISIGDKVTLL